MAQTILAELTAPTRFTQLDRSRLAGCLNTIPSEDLGIRRWSAWRDFTYDNIIATFGDHLAKPYQGDREPRLVSNDLVQFNELTIQDSLRRLPIATVNHALAGFPGAAHYGDGARVPIGTRSRPDWSVIEEYNTPNEYRNSLVGDTKVSVKWQQDMIRTDNNEWQKPVNQVVGYMTAANGRYGFIVTDAVVVVLRLVRKDTGIGLAAAPEGRPSRRVNKNPNLYKEDSDTSVDESAPRSSSPYIDDTPRDWQLQLEHAVIHWDPSQNKSRLTPKLALWALAMMATYGDSDIDYSYPQFNTWRTQPDGSIVHNTSGKKLNGPCAGCVVQERGATAAAASSSSSSRAEASGSGHSRSGSSAQYVLPVYEAVPPVPRLPALSPADSSYIEVRVRREGRRYFFSDYRGETQSSRRDDWERVSGGYLYLHKRHAYFTGSLDH
ncbi:hypothetical protein BM221_004448 [Beauveria bassiana]|uniref:Uncharacterized protein n=1 Tax=Beauveria bassiana TaxID=176275 RepID=A0A2N6NR93_BEABA|nr:hypothetical protein BM221_004448 [Beauveria bassiana]